VLEEEGEREKERRQGELNSKEGYLILKQKYYDIRKRGSQWVPVKAGRTGSRERGRGERTG
jgi:hypothetical protein